jgi:hypothetical protein
VVGEPGPLGRLQTFPKPISYACRLRCRLRMMMKQTLAGPPGSGNNPSRNRQQPARLQKILSLPPAGIILVALRFASFRHLALEADLAAKQH